MTRQIKINVNNADQLNKRIIDFFKTSDFKLLENKGNCLKFRQNSSLLEAWKTNPLTCSYGVPGGITILLEAWKTNPLTWGSEIVVSLSNNTIIAVFIGETETQMNTKEEEAVWKTFIENFQNYLTNGVKDNSTLHSIIAESKKMRIRYLGWSILGCLTGGMLAFFYASITKNHSTLSILMVPIMATIFLRWRMNYVKTKDIL